MAPDVYFDSGMALHVCVAPGSARGLAVTLGSACPNGPLILQSEPVVASIGTSLHNRKWRAWWCHAAR